MDGTDLSLAYGDSYDMDNGYMSPNNFKSKSTYKDPGLAMPKEPPRTMDLPLPKMSSSPPENPNYNVPQDMYASQGNNFEPNYNNTKSKYASESTHLSFWDKIGQKKKEVIKVFILSLVIVLGISIDHISKHYLDNYISKSFLTETQEFLVRLSYPVMIILLIWIIKASV